MSQKRLHPLNALRAFEASARNLSFVMAAEELHVTPAAISHQIKKLEDYLGVALFRRLPRRLLLTETGAILLSDLSGIFLRLDKAMDRIAEAKRREALTISVAPMFAVKWLVPRLHRFAAGHPKIDVRMSSSLALIDFHRDGFDASVRLGQGSYPGLTSVKLLEETVTPMCSPRLLGATGPLNDPGELRKRTLLHDDSMTYDPNAPTWDSWLRAAGVSQIDTETGPRFGQPDHALQAAIDGAGVALGWRSLAAEDIAAGRLVAPFDLSLPLGAAFYLVYPDAYADVGKITSFKTWLIDEMTQSMA